MEYLKIHHCELAALIGLPHLQQLLYLRGLRPFMDSTTSFVGIKRRISYQSLSEELYIEPHQGIKSGSPSKSQIRRALNGLEKAGLIKCQSSKTTLIYQCLLVAPNYSDQIKAVTKPSHYADTRIVQENPQSTGLNLNFIHEPVSVEPTKAVIPLNNNNYIFYLSKKFEKFWELYPQKSGKQKAWEAFVELNPDEDLFKHIFEILTLQVQVAKQRQASGSWIPAWKYPANWLAQHCWEDEIPVEITEENHHAKYRTNTATEKSVDPFWDSCKAGAEFNYERATDDHVSDHRDLTGGSQTH